MKRPKKNPDIDDALAGESIIGADDASALPARLDRFSKAHHRAIRMSDYARERGEVKLANELQDCGAYLLFRDYHTVGKVRLHAMHSCKRHLLCPLCAIRRGAKMVKSYLDRLQVVLAENPNLKPYLVTLTVKDGEDLTERFNHLSGSLQRLHRTRNRKGQFNESCKASGAVWSYEFKRGENSGLWHPHVHAIWLCETPPDQVALRAQWKRITGDSHICDVRPFHDDQDVLGGFLEVFKYAVKFSDLPMADNWDGWKRLAGKRLIASFGTFRGVVVPEELTDEQLEDLPYVEALYRFIYGAGYSYEKKNDLPPDVGLKRPRGAVQVEPPKPYKKGYAHLQRLRKKYD